MLERVEMISVLCVLLCCFQICFCIGKGIELIDLQRCFVPSTQSHAKTYDMNETSI